MSQKKSKEFIIHVKADVFFEAIIKADTLKQAVETAEGMTYEQLWDAPGSVTDSEHKLVGVFS